MLKVFALLLALTVAPINGTNILYREIFEYHNETDEKATFAFEVVEKINSAFKQWFFTVIFCDFTYFENRILKYTETLKTEYPVLLLSSCPDNDRVRFQPKITKHGETTYIVSSDDLSTDLNEYVIKALIKTGIWKPRSTVIFVINIPVRYDSYEYFYHKMKTHFQFLWSNRITNSVLVTWADKLRIYTFNPYLDEVKDITDEKNINRYLAKQYENLYGKEMRLSVFNKIYLNDKKSDNECKSNLIDLFMTTLNATCVPLRPRDKTTVGDILKNGTATGATADLIDSYVELELNSRILQTSYYGYIDTTYPLVQDELCFLVKKSGLQSSFTTTLKLMRTDVLSIFIANIFIFSFVAVVAFIVEKDILKANMNKKISDVIMDLIKCFIRQTLDVTFIGPVFRSVVLIIIIYSLIIDCAIDGILISAISYPRYKSDLNTLSDLAKSDLILAVHNRHMELFKASLSPNYEELLLSPIEAFNDRKIKRALDNKDYKYAILLRKTEARMISRKLSNIVNGRPLYHTVEECPLPCFIVYGLEYGSPYLPIINRILRNLHQGGILKYWNEVEEYQTYKKNDKFLYNEAGQKRPLAMSNVKEVFYVGLIGMFFSIIVFICEMCFHNLTYIHH